MSNPIWAVEEGDYDPHLIGLYSTVERIKQAFPGRWRDTGHGYWTNDAAGENRMTATPHEIDPYPGLTVIDGE